MTKIPSNSSIGLSKLDRRISVAPMMDWTDEVDFSIKARELQVYKKACPLYVSSKIAHFP